MQQRHTVLDRHTSVIIDISVSGGEGSFRVDLEPVGTFKEIVTGRGI